MRTILIAENGKILTDGANYNRRIILPEGKVLSDFCEITLNEYQSRMEEEICRT